MLTQQQANDLNIQQHAMEAAEIAQSKAQKEMDRYYQAMQNATNQYNNLSPENQAKVTALLPEITNKYNQAKAARARAEDAYWQSLNKVNQYKALDAQQVSIQAPGKRRVVSRTINSTVPNTTVPNTTVNGWGGSTWPEQQYEFYDNSDIAKKFFGNDYNNYKISTYNWDYYKNWSVTIYPNGGVGFEPVEESKPNESLRLFNSYYSRKADPQNWQSHLNYLHNTMPNYFDVDEAWRLRLWRRMVRDWLEPGQADEFLDDWEESFTP